MSSSEYATRLTQAMNVISDRHDAVFLGQAVRYPGTYMYKTLEAIPKAKRVEMPVAEEMQLGVSIGLSLAGWLPVSIYPRWNFFILAANQLVNHLDKLPLMSGYEPKVIIRVGVGSERPLYPGPQHVGDFSTAFQLLLETIPIVTLTDAEEILPAYQNALERRGSTILVEYADLY